MEKDVQDLLQRFETEEPTTGLPLTDEQRDWLYRAVHIFQAHENKMRIPATPADKAFTEAMIRYIKNSFGM